MVGNTGPSTIQYIPSEDSFSISATDSAGVSKTLKGLANVEQEGTNLKITDSTGHEYSVSPPGVIIEQIVGPRMNIIGSGNILTLNKLQHKSDAVWLRVHAETFLDRGTVDGFTNSDRAAYTNPSWFSRVESSARPLTILHKYTVPRVNGQAFVRVTVRFNHSPCLYGICYKRGNLICYSEEAHNPGNSVENRTLLWDITGITGDLVVFTHSNKWWTGISSAEVISNNQNFSFLKGTWNEFNNLKDSLAETSQYYITNINRGNGVLAIKIGTTWRDCLGRPITQNYTA